MPQPPNILFLFSDQHRFDCLGAAEHPVVKTPALDRLAEQSVRFTNAYCPAPLCGPSRAALFTGMYPPGCGVVENWTPRRPGLRLLTERLSQQGYYNALVGKLHLTPVADRHGFDHKALCDSPHGVYDPDETVHNDYRRLIEHDLFHHDRERAEHAAGQSERLDISDPRFWLGWSWVDDAHHMNTWAGDEAVRFLGQWDQHQPCFLNVSFFGPHHPYATCEPWDSMYPLATIDLPQTLRQQRNGPVWNAVIEPKRQRWRDWDEDIWRRMISAYYGQISQIDAAINRILNALIEEGMWDNTMIVFTADHGDHIGEFGLVGKGDLYETSVRVPLMIKPAGSNAAGQWEGPVNTLDLFGTFLDAAGEPHWQDDPRIEAGSLWSILHAQNSSERRDVFAISGSDPDTNQTMLRRGNLKLLRVARKDESAGYELYDLAESQIEQYNWYNDAVCREARREMQVQLDNWWTAQKANYPR